jgi:hypothetical protein
MGGDTGSGLKRISHPTQFRSVPLPGDCDHVETTRAVCKPGVLLEEYASSPGDTQLLFGGHRVQRASVLIAATIPDFNEYRAFTVSHDEINLTQSAVKISCHDA